MDRVKVNGRRGAFLILFGLVFGLIGLSYCTTGPQAPVWHYMSWMPWWSPLWVCGIFWLGSGVVAIAAAFWPMPEDRYGFMALSAVATGWTVAYVVAALAGTAPRGWVSAAIFGLLAAAIQVVSGMPNPISRRRGE